MMNFAIIDLETTGTDPSFDSIIDIGYLEISIHKNSDDDHYKVELLGKLSSLVRFSGTLPPFITYLTGIKSEDLIHAPTMDELAPNLTTLFSRTKIVLAHNASFEESFLKMSFVPPDLIYIDTIPLLSLLFPKILSLSLENFITTLGISQKEEHRGYSDVIDLVKVILLGIYNVQEEIEKGSASQVLFLKYVLSLFPKDHFYHLLWSLPKESIRSFATLIDFDVATFSMRYYSTHSKNFNLREQYLEDLKNSLQMSSSHKVESKLNSSLLFSGQNVESIWNNLTLLNEKGSELDRRAFKEISLLIGKAIQHKVSFVLDFYTATIQDGRLFSILLPLTLKSFSSEEEKYLITYASKEAYTKGDSVGGMDQLNHYPLRLKKMFLQMISLFSVESFQVRGGELLLAEVPYYENYICHLTYDSFQKIDSIIGESGLSPFSHLFIHHLFSEGITDVRSIPSILLTKNGELNDILKFFVVNPKLCQLKDCPKASSCSYYNEMKIASEARIIFANQQIIYKWKEQKLPLPDLVIHDEGHHFLQVTENIILEEVGRGTLLWALKFLKTFIPITHAIQIIGEIDQVLKESFLKRRYFSPQFWNDLLVAELLSTDGGQDKDKYKKGKQGTSIQLTLSIFEEEQKQSADLELFKRLSKEIEYLITLLPKELYQNFFFKLVVQLLLTEVKTIKKILKNESASEKEFISLYKFHQELGWKIENYPLILDKFNSEDLLDSPSVVIGNGFRYQSAIDWNLGLKHKNERDKSESKVVSSLYPKSKVNVISEDERRMASKVFLSLCSDSPPLNTSHFISRVSQELLKSLFSEKIHLEKQIKSFLTIESNSDDSSVVLVFLLSSRKRLEGAREIFLTYASEHLVSTSHTAKSEDGYTFQKGNLTLILKSLPWNDFEHLTTLFREQVLGGSDSKRVKTIVVLDKFPDLAPGPLTKAHRDYYDKEIGNEFNDYFWALRAMKLKVKLEKIYESIPISSTNLDYLHFIITDSRAAQWKDKSFNQIKDLLKPYEINFTSFFSS